MYNFFLEIWDKISQTDTTIKIIFCLNTKFRKNANFNSGNEPIFIVIKQFVTQTIIISKRN